MLDENLQKISELADRSISDVVTANILLCYLMQKLDKPLDADLLYEICVANGIINYFTFQDTMQTLEETNAVSCTLKNDKKYYSLTQKGSENAERFHHLIGKSYRDRILQTAEEAIKHQKLQEQLKISYETLPQGCHLHVKLVDHELVLLELTLFTPDEHHARLLGDKIIANPSAVYHKILSAVIPEQDS